MPNKPILPKPLQERIRNNYYEQQPLRLATTPQVFQVFALNYSYSYYNILYSGMGGLSYSS